MADAKALPGLSSCLEGGRRVDGLIDDVISSSSGGDIVDHVYNRRFVKAYIDLYNMRIDFQEFAERIKKPKDEAMKLLTEYKQAIVRGEIDDPRGRCGWR